MPSYNPLPVTNAAGSFFASSDGYIAGMALDDPGLRYQLQSAIVALASAALMYAGVGVSAKIANQVGVAAALGKTIDQATSIANLRGFAVSNQSYAGIQLPQSQVPIYSPGMALNFYEFGSGARIPLPISSANAQALLGNDDGPQLSWDYTNQVVIPYTAGGANAGAIPGTGPGGLAKIIDIQVGNSRIVVPNNPAAGEASWNEAGSVIVLQI